MVGPTTYPTDRPMFMTADEGTKGTGAKGMGKFAGESTKGTGAKKGTKPDTEDTWGSWRRSGKRQTNEYLLSF